MEAAVQNVVNNYNYYFYDQANPITRDWFLAAKPLQLACILTFYFYFCTRLGPRFMKDRNPYDVKNVMTAYNLFQILLSVYIAVKATRYLMFYNFNICCQGLEPDETITRWVAGGVWTYYIAKITELLDTVFFVLRKSNRQITSLHLHHHIIMSLAAWFGTTFHPGGQGILIGYINAIVHMFMYTYYLIAGLGDNFKKYLWWKKHLTELQLAQFIIIGIHTTNSMFYQCDYRPALKVMTLIYCLFFIYSFGKFYYINYIKKTK